VWQPTALYGTLPARPDQTIAGTISHQTSTGDASSTTDLPLSNQSRLIVNDDGLDDPRHDLLYGHQMKMVISTYNTATKTHILTNVKIKHINIVQSCNITTANFDEVQK